MDQRSTKGVKSQKLRRMGYGLSMKYGAMNFPIKSLLKEVEEIGEMGFDYVELTMDPPEATPQKIRPQKRSIKQALDRYRMGIMGHLPTFVMWESL